MIPYLLSFLSASGLESFFLSSFFGGGLRLRLSGLRRFWFWRLSNNRSIIVPGTERFNRAQQMKNKLR